MKDYFSDINTTNDLAPFKEVAQEHTEYSADLSVSGLYVSEPDVVMEGMELGLNLNAAGGEEMIIPLVTGIVKELGMCVVEYKKCKMHEETERKRINAQLKAVIAQIEAEKEKFMAELERDRIESEKVYKCAEELRDIGIETNDKDLLKYAGNLMLQTYALRRKHT